MAWDDRMHDFRARRARARAMGGAERVARRAAEGRLNARERVARLLDDGSFMAIGTFNVSDVPGMEALTPADSKGAGLGSRGRHGGRVYADGCDKAVSHARSSRASSTCAASA